MEELSFCFDHQNQIEIIVSYHENYRFVSDIYIKLIYIYKTDIYIKLIYRIMTLRSTGPFFRFCCCKNDCFDSFSRCNVDIASCFSYTKSSIISQIIHHSQPRIHHFDRKNPSLFSVKTGYLQFLLALRVALLLLVKPCLRAPDIARRRLQSSPF